MLPEDIAKGGSEHAHQAALFCWCSLPETKAQYPLLSTPLFFAIPNGGSRGDTARSAQLIGGKMKAEGVKPGVFDTFLAVSRGGWHGLFLEMKKPNGTISPAQKIFGPLANQQGYAICTCYNWEEAKNKLIEYMNLT